MGRSYTPKYRLEIKDNVGWHWLNWLPRGQYGIKGHGAPSEVNLEKYVRSYAKSLEIGGVNEHVSLALGYVPYPTAARIVNQETNEVVASWTAGMFQVW